MATVHPAQQPSHHRGVPKKVPLNAPRQQPAYNPSPPQQIHLKTDPFYGYEYIAQLSGQFITHLFACPPFPPQFTHSQAKLPYFIAYTLHRTKLHRSDTYAALVLLRHLGACFPAARGSSGHRLFVSAFVVVSGVICDDAYLDESLSIVAQGMFTLREINQMEREMCNYLDWKLTVHNPTFGQQRQATPTEPYPAPPPPAIPPRLYKNSASPMTPDTLTHSYSNTMFPASSISPPTPTGPVDLTAGIHGPGGNCGMSPGLSLSSEIPQIHPLKGKVFAFAIPAVW
ncbi:hypothetical protein B0H14DRAFT_3773460 [Mycena olivaceomarginata]|nr:hypothetical protein B0H14DRAFT_3773460 [Mycena olivaceomarginata]